AVLIYTHYDRRDGEAVLSEQNTRALLSKTSFPFLSRLCWPSGHAREHQGVNMFRKRSFISLAAASASFGGMAIGAIAHVDDVASLDKHGDITSMCGKKPAFVAFQDGFGGATWFKTAAAEVKDELSKCPTVTKFVYLDANNDQQKYNSDINGLVAQGVNVLI